MKIEINSKSMDIVRALAQQCQWSEAKALDVLIVVGTHGLNGHQIMSDRMRELERANWEEDHA